MKRKLESQREETSEEVSIATIIRENLEKVGCTPETHSVPQNLESDRAVENFITNLRTAQARTEKMNIKFD